MVVDDGGSLSGYATGRTFEAFFQATYARVARVLGLAWADSDAVEDAAQEAFARALSRWSRVGQMERPDGWVYVTASNLLRRRLQGSRGAGNPVPGGSEGSSGDRSDAVVNQIVTRDALGRLPSRQREVVVLRYLAGLSTAETAEAMGCAEGTVKASLAKALGALRVDMENSDET